MSATTLYPDILGIDFDCQGDSIKEIRNCPMQIEGAGPTVDTYTGEVSCDLCGKVLTFTKADENQLYDDDPDDDEMDTTSDTYVPVGEVNLDWTDSQKKRNRREARLNEIIEEITPHEPEVAFELSNRGNNTYNSIIDKLLYLEEINHPTFEGGEAKAKLLAIGLHLLKVELKSNTYSHISRVRPAQVLKYRKALETQDRPLEDNQTESLFNSIGSKAGVPTSIISNVYDKFVKESPYNPVDNERVRIAAWIYHKARMSGVKPTKKSFTDQSGISRPSFSKALKSYEEQFRNVKENEKVIGEISENDE